MSGEPPVVVLQQTELEAWRRAVQQGRPGEVPEPAACCFDDGAAYHLYLEAPRLHLAGRPSAALVLRDDGLSDPATRDQAIEQLAAAARRRGLAAEGVILAIGAGPAQPREKAFVWRGGELVAANVSYVPARAELYSRSRGLLEIAVLENKKVAIVGLGSGGSAIAVEFAKAGIGHFVLIDHDRLEPGNITRHACGLGDVGRFKTRAVRDLLLGKNPYVAVETIEIDINDEPVRTRAALSGCDLLIGATDTDRSRFGLNQLSLDLTIPAIYGRVLSRAYAGDVVRVRPGEGPCLACIFTQQFLTQRPVEISNPRQAGAAFPQYADPQLVEQAVQVGLASDIAPVINMIVKLALLELSRGNAGGLASLEDDLTEPMYIWANRREDLYAHWKPLGSSYANPTILRWFGARVARREDCPVCGEISIDPEEDPDLGA